jgi:hypothetical protein
MTFKGKIPWNKGKPWSKEIRDKISKSLKGKPKPWNSHPLSEEHKRKVGESNLGRTAWNKGKKTGIIPWNKGLKGSIPWNKGRTYSHRKTRTKHGNSA